MIWVDFVKQGFICKWRRIGPAADKEDPGKSGDWI